MTFRNAVRKRPGMYVGGVDAMALHHLAFMAFDQRAIEMIVEASHPRGLKVQYVTDWEFDVSQTRALFERIDKIGFEDEKGVGEWPWLGVIWALSEQFLFEVGGESGFVLEDKDGTLFERPSRQTDGVSLTFVADADVFDEYEFRTDVLAARMRHLAAFHPACTFRFRESGVERVFAFPGGLHDLLVEDCAGVRRLPNQPIVIRESKGSMAVEVAMTWVVDVPTSDVRVYANTVRNDGGVHLDGLVAGIEDFFRNHGIYSAAGWMAGLRVLLNVTVPREEYRNPTKSVLANPNVEAFVRRSVARALQIWAGECEGAPELFDRIKWRIIADC